MPTPADPWPAAGRPGRRRWPVVAGLVAAVLLTALVAGAVVGGARTPRTGAGGPPGTAVPPATPVTASPVPSTATTTPATPDPAPSTAPTPAPAPASLPVATPTGTPSAPTPGPASPAPTTSAGTPGPVRPAGPTGPDVSLEANTLYRVDLHGAAVACDLTVRAPRPALPDKKLGPYLRTVVHCLHTAFAGPLAAQGFTLREPKVTTYHASVHTPCGTFGQKGSPAYYCSATQTIYWPETVDDGNEAYTFARLGYVALVAHEFGHHLQASTGMLGEYGYAYASATQAGRYGLSRRLELQAQCFEGVFLTVARRPVHLTDDDRAELRTWHGYTGDEDPPARRKPDHGTSRAQYRWLARGLDSADLGRCNTWTALAKDVR